MRTINQSWLLPRLPRLAFAPAHRAPAGDTLVVIFLRGAADVLNMVVPHAEPAYYSQRPTLGIARPDDRRTPPDQRTLDLDGFFGFHPAMRPLLESWQSRQLAIVHALRRAGRIAQPFQGNGADGARR
ncbi:MAG: hypothetical protein IPN59_13355 [Holophaga sp.]|nr:hypothetical protein [Holophaga sp.]